MKLDKAFFFNKKNIAILTALLMLICVGTYFIFFHGGSGEMLFVETGFETDQIMLTGESWKGSGTTYDITTEQVHSGSQALVLSSEMENDARYIYKWKAQKDTYYKVSCWMKTENVGEETMGANLSVEQCYFYFGDIKGTQDWTYVEGYFRVISDKNVTLMLRLGGYSSENTGTVYFDDLTIEQVKSLPAGMDINMVNTVGNTTATSQEKVDEWHYDMSYTSVFVMLSMVLVLIYCAMRAASAEGKEPFFRGQAALFLLFASALILRFVAAPVAIGFEGDVYLFERWGNIMSQDIGQFYVNANAQAGLADYPPFYMYILGIIGKIMDWLGFAVGTTAYKLAIKMPPMLADMVSAFFIYLICEKLEQTEKGRWLNDGWKLFFAGIYLFNPMVLFDSVVWGQMDSFLAMFMLFAIYAVMKKKVTLSAILFAICILIKPQGLFAGPVLLFYVLREGTIKQKIANFFKCAGAILATAFVITLPYTLQNITFIYDLFTETAGRYDYASVNGFNFFTLMGLNWVTDTGVYNSFWGIPYYAWGMIFLGVIVIAGGVLYMLLPKEYEHRELLIALFLVTGIFNFTVRMHERYLFPAILLSLVVAILDNSRFMMRIHALLTTTSFFNALIILGKYNSDQDLWDWEGYTSITYVSAANVLAFVLILVYVILKIAKVETAKIATVKEKEELADDAMEQSEGVLE